MSIRSKGLIFAMEEAEVTDVEGSESEIAEGMSEIDSGVVDMTQDETEIDDLDMAIEEAVEDAETLEDIGDVMEESVESGEGLSPEAAEMAEIAVEAIYNRLGIRNKTAMPAMESFGSSSSRLAATRIALEDVKETLKGIWEKIKTAFNSMMKAIKEFIFKHLSAIGMLKKTVASFQKTLDKFEEKNKKSDKFENNSLAEAYKAMASANHKSASDYLDNVSGFIDTVGTYQGNLESKVKDMESVITDATSGMSWSDFEKKAEAKSAAFKSIFDDLAKGNSASDTSDAGRTIVRLPYNKKLSVVMDSNADNTDPLAKVVEADDSSAAKIAAACDTLSKSQMQDLLKKVNDVASKLETTFKGKANPDKLTKTMNQLIDKAIKASETADNKEDEDFKKKKQELVKQRRKVTQLNQTTGILYRRAVGDSIKTCRLTLTYIKESMKQYSAKAPE